jgi:hypothetical protein
MVRDDEYRKHAADAQRMADRVISPIDKESWLRVAQGWLALISKPQQSAQQAFDDDAKARGTGQDDSTGSH